MSRAPYRHHHRKKAEPEVSPEGTLSIAELAAHFEMSYNWTRLQLNDIDAPQPVAKGNGTFARRSYYDKEEALTFIGEIVDGFRESIKKGQPETSRELGALKDTQDGYIFYGSFQSHEPIVSEAQQFFKRQAQVMHDYQRNTE